MIFPGHEHPSPEWAKMPVGWDGYDAEPPGLDSIATAARFCNSLSPWVYPRVRPSVVGGVGVAIKRGARKAYVEFYNDGKAAVLFSDGTTEPVAREIRTDDGCFVELGREIAAYLAAEAA